VQQVALQGQRVPQDLQEPLAQLVLLALIVQLPDPLEPQGQQDQQVLQGQVVQQDLSVQLVNHHLLVQLGQQDLQAQLVQLALLVIQFLMAQ
jgi:hypothetical protein